MIASIISPNGEYAHIVACDNCKKIHEIKGPVTESVDIPGWYVHVDDNDGYYWAACSVKCRKAISKDMGLKEIVLPGHADITIPTL